MSTFGLEDLPDEIILDICSKTETQALVKMSETSHRINQVCSEILEQRKQAFIQEKKAREKEAFLKMKANSILNILRRTQFTERFLDKEIDGKENFIKINKHGSIFFIESISILPSPDTNLDEYRRLFPWILPSIPPTQDMTYTLRDRRWVRFLSTTDINLVRVIIENALRLGYKH